MNLSHRQLLIEIAERAMQERGLRTAFAPEAMAELERLRPIDWAMIEADPGIRDQRDLLWCSIDNDDSRDLDQLTAGEALPGDRLKVLVAIADVDALVPKDSALDIDARQNTTTVYTPAKIFSMLPEKLSTDLTSLNYGEDRLAMVIEMTINADGSLHDSTIYQAAVRNHARLSYQEVADWLDGKAPAPAALARVPGLDDSLRLQDRAGQQMKRFRHANGALSFETIESNPVLEGDRVVALVGGRKNRASQMIENFMITTNGVTARFLSDNGSPSIRRVVLAPTRWERIVEVAQSFDVKLPPTPDSGALEAFLTTQRTADPQRFPDLSLTIVKLIGGGEYVAELPGDLVPDHFSLAARDYTHSTAPNRRYTDLVTHRLLKAAIAGDPPPYTIDELTELAKHFTAQENQASKVERQVDKAAAALLLQKRVGEHFQAIVTGASPKGTWVRLEDLPVEGRLVTGFDGLDVGNITNVRLSRVNVERGFIDFKRVSI